MFEVWKEKKEIAFWKFALMGVLTATVGYVWGLIN